jgi:hypothetical protein
MVGLGVQRVEGTVVPHDQVGPLDLFFDRHLGPQHMSDQLHLQASLLTEAKGLDAFGGGHRQIEIPTQGKPGFVEQRNLHQKNSHARRKIPVMIDRTLKDQRMQQSLHFSTEFPIFKQELAKSHPVEPAGPSQRSPVTVSEPPRHS